MTAAPHHPRARLERLERPEDLARLQAAAAADRHAVLMPTHLALRGEEIIGYASIGGILLLTCWADTRRATKFDSFRLLREVERLAGEAGQGRPLCLPCTPDSPFFDYLPQAGYTRLGLAALNLKRMDSR